MKHDIASQFSGSQGSTGLGRVLQGVQHVGVTVDDMAKSLEFYVGVLGGRIAALGQHSLDTQPADESGDEYHCTAHDVLPSKSSKLKVQSTK